MDTFYFLFDGLQHYGTWAEKGFAIGCMILLLSTLLYGLIFYIALGRSGMRFASLRGWLLFGFYNALTVFAITLCIEGFQVFEFYAIEDFDYEIWLFSIINACYAWVCYFIVSLGFKRLSIHSKFIPLKF